MKLAEDIVYHPEVNFFVPFSIKKILLQPFNMTDLTNFNKWIDSHNYDCL
jgi:hypothetical protein